MVILFLLLDIVASQIFSPLSMTPSTTAITCNKYQCDPNPSKTRILFSYCITFNHTTSTFLLDPCDHSDVAANFCNPTDDPNETPVTCSVPETQYENMYPGDYPCAGNSSCVTQYCLDSICQGSDYSEPCNSSQDCNAGLQCDFGTCVPLLRPGEYGCYNDTNCVNTCGCDTQPESNQPGVCIEYFSVDLYDYVTNCYGLMSLLCEEINCIPVNTTHYQCIPAFVSNNDLPRMCESDSDCWGSSAGVIATGSCDCGYNPTGQSYCSPLPGDSLGLNLMKEMQKWIDSLLILACNTEARFSLSCMRHLNYKFYDAIKYRLYAYSMHPYLQMNDDCVSTIYTTLYWDAKDDFSSDNAAIGLVLSWIISLSI